MVLSGEGPERTLEMPRSLGVGFNPVRFHYRLDGGEVESLAAEVTNTPWGERRTYRFDGRSGTCGQGDARVALPADGPRVRVQRHAARRAADRAHREPARG